MKTEKLILNYQRRGIKLSVSDNKLHFSAPQNILTDEDKDILKKNKKEIIKFLLDHTESEIIVDEEDKYEKFPLTDIQLSYLVGQDNVYKFGGTNCKIYTEIEYEQIELNKAQYAWEQVIKYNDMLHAVINQEGTQEILSSYTVPEYDESTLDGLENQYLRSKVKAEKVLKNAKNQGVQSSIYRMSGILFDSKTGKYQINVNESSAYIYYRNLYRLRIVPSEIQRKMDISCVDKISEAVVKLILSDDRSNDVYHVINPNGLTIKEILNCFKDCENNKDIIMKELSVEEIYNYYKKTDTKEQELFKQLVFECEIVNDIGKCDLNIGGDRTIFILEQLGFKWEKVGREEIIRAYHAIRESKKSGKKQY